MKVENEGWKLRLEIKVENSGVTAISYPEPSYGIGCYY
jgi:hypothetical protein